MAPALKTPPAEIAATLLDFTDAEFLAAPDIDVHAREVRLLETDFIGIAINAQQRIVVDAQSVLPIAIATRYDGERDWDLPLVDNCLLVATDLSSGQVSVVPALVPPKVLASRGGTRHDRGGAARPPAEELEGAGAQLSWTELRSRMAIPWRSGRWSFELVYFDWLSNRVCVELAGAPPAPSGAATPRTVSPLPAAPTPGLPTFQPTDRTPPTPAHGVRFALELDERGPARRLYVDGAFAGPARAHSLVAGMTLADGASACPVAAVVPLTLLLVGANAVYPWRLDLAVPAYGAPAHEDEMLTGCFSLDALAGAPAPGPGDYACYVVMDGAIHGPQPLHVTA
jgi:hypothetical protein